MGAPIRNTCPDVDRSIRTLKSAIDTLDNIDADDPYDVKRGVKYAISEIEDLEGEFEGLRKSNATLREWGEGLEGEVESAAQTISQLEDEIERLKETIESYEKSYT